MSVRSIDMSPVQRKHSNNKTKGAAAIGASLGALGGGYLGLSAGCEFGKGLTHDTIHIANAKRLPGAASMVGSQSLANLSEADKVKFFQTEKLFKAANQMAKKLTLKTGLAGMGIGIAIGATILGTLGYGIAKLCSRNK